MTVDLAQLGTLASCPAPSIDVVAATRSATILMVDSEQVMSRNSAPAGWEGDAARLATHVMTKTARELDAQTAALEIGLAALKAYCDQVATLSRSHRRLEGEREALERRVPELQQRLDAGVPDAGLLADVEHFNQQVKAWNDSAARWKDSLTHAQHSLMSSLTSADTRAEAMRLRHVTAMVTSLEKYANKISDDPHAVYKWWSTLPQGDREMLKVQYPQFIGSLDGIPIADRDEANRAHLTATQKALLQLPEGMRTAAQKRQLTRINGIRNAVDTSGLAAETQSFLLLFSSSAAHGDGYAAVSYGNPETADHVSVNVPGFSSTLNNFQGVARSAANVYTAANRQGHGTVASIAWLGYDAPDLSADGQNPMPSGEDAAHVAREQTALTGARKLSRFVDGLRATDQGSRAHLTVIGHSYGSVVVAKAAHTAGEDDVVLVGSPGAGGGNTSAKDLLPGQHVYVGDSDNDFVSHLGSTGQAGLGVDPAGKDFGATRFRVAPGKQFDAGTKQGWHNSLADHSAYFAMHEVNGRQIPSESLRNIADVVAGHGNQATRTPERGNGADETWWTEQAAKGAWHDTKATASLLRKSINVYPWELP